MAAPNEGAAEEEAVEIRTRADLADELADELADGMTCGLAVLMASRVVAL